LLKKTIQVADEEDLIVDFKEHESGYSKELAASKIGLDKKELTHAIDRINKVIKQISE